jgi:Tat protein translocase TatB subunit
MFDVGFAELVLLFVIGLLVLGPERLPKVAAELGRWVGRARRTATQLRRQLEREVELSEVIQPPRPPPRVPSAPEAPAPSTATAATSPPLPSATPDSNDRAPDA